MLNKLCNNNVKVIGIKLLLLMLFITSIVITKDNVKASSPSDFKYEEIFNYDYTTGESIGTNKYEITEYNGTDIDVEIPAVIDGHLITKISSWAFNSNTNIRSVIIQEGIVDIGSFRGCTSLESITIPESVSNLYSFYGCISLKNIRIPQNVSLIVRECFRNCLSLESIDIYSKELSIGDYCFYDCNSLKEFNCYNTTPKLGKGVFTNTKIMTNEAEDNFRNLDITTAIILPGTVEMPYDAFMGCENLKTLSIEDPSFINFNSTNASSKGALYGCNNLEEVTFTNGSAYYNVVDGIIYTKDMTRLVRCLPGKRGKVSIPSSVTKIDTGAFHGCKYLEDELIIPNSVTKIESYAFYGCMSEVPIKLSENLVQIYDCTFANSKFTGNLVIPDSVTRIGNLAFYNCSNFTGSLQMGENVKYIGACAFYNCSSLNGDITFNGKMSSVGKLAFASCEGLNGKIDFRDIEEYFYLDEYAFAQDLNIEEVKSNLPISSIEEGAFLNCSSLRNISSINWAFNYSLAGCGSLVSVNINGLRGSDVLRGLKNLEELRINNATTELGRTVLAECPKLKTLYIPSSVTTIADNAFYKTENIQDIYVDSNRENISYAHILESVCKHVHYKDSKYTISKLHNDDIEITDIESNYDEGYKVGSTYKFKVEPKLGYTINNLRVVLKIDENENQAGYEIENELVAVDGIYTIENVNRNMEIVVETNSSLINPNAESDS